MTDKQERILEAALELFATEGFNAVSTIRIAKKAGVSEGLIFRHFANKKGLLDALARDAESRISRMFGPVLMETDPRKVIRKTINLPFSVPEEDYHFWRLQFKLKWEQAYSNPEKMKPVLDKLSSAFHELGYSDPETEAQLLNGILDSLGISLVRGEIGNADQFRQFLLDKYNV